MEPDFFVLSAFSVKRSEATGSIRTMIRHVAACYKGLFMVGYESGGNLFYGSGDCGVSTGSPTCAIAEHCDTCISSESHDNYFYNANTCLRMEVNQDDNVHDDRCYDPTEQGFNISTREGQVGDTVIVTELTNGTTGSCGPSYSSCGNLVHGTGVTLGTATNGLPLGTCPNTTWSSANGAGTQVTLTMASSGSPGLLISQDLGSATAWIGSPILEICISSNTTLNPAQLQFVLTDCPTGMNCATTALATPHTRIAYGSNMCTGLHC